MESRYIGDPCEAIERAVRLLIDGDRNGARSALESVDQAGLVRLRNEVRARARAAIGSSKVQIGLDRTRSAREEPPAGVKHATFVRDRFTCRYAHCGRRTIAAEVLQLLSRAYPDVLPYHPHWKDVDKHIVFWVLQASPEHVVPFPEGGTSAPSNLVTACYLCNDTKNSYPMEVLKWKLTDPATHEWQGLTEYLPDLRRAVRGNRGGPR